MSRRLRVIVLVSNDLSTDQRVLKVCNTLHLWGHEPVLTGRELPESLAMSELPFQTHRIKLFFRRGPAFYTELALRLFFRLLFAKMDAIHANDLDTLLPAYLVARLRRKQLVYDTHEYFTGVPELVRRPTVRKIWKTIEQFIFPKLAHVYTVNDSIAALYRSDYGKELKVVRNIPSGTRLGKSGSRKAYGLPDDCFLIILQGNGINVDRGGEEAVEMMKGLDGCLLLIAGSGDVLPQLKSYVANEQLSDKVRFISRMPYEKLMQITMLCDLGLTLDKDTNINYRFSLPNKLFDYIHAGIPVLASDLVEVSRVVNHYRIGVTVSNVTADELIVAVNRLRENQQQLETFRTNCSKAAAELTWEHEIDVIREWY